VPTVRPQTASDPLRTRLVEAAARIVATEGHGALSLRRVAADVGTSTMAIYTHFGGMPELLRAVRWDGFHRLAADLAEVPAAEDPVEHVVGLCVAYVRNGIANPDLYRVMFMEEPLDEEDAAVCAGTFETLVVALARCVQEGRLSPADPLDLATELWVAGHGVVSLRLAGALAPDAADAGMPRILRRLLVGFGADEATVDRAIAAEAR
jgi:AcrR family transcriptional regulator